MICTSTHGSRRSKLDEIKVICSDTSSYKNTPSEQLQSEHEHTLPEIEQAMQDVCHGRDGTEQDHLDADHYMGALALLLAQHIDDPSIQQRVQKIVEQYRGTCDDWWYS